MATYQECASKIGEHIQGDKGHKHIENGAIPAFQKELAVLQKQDAARKSHDQEFAATKTATDQLVTAGMIPSLKINNLQALFVAGATADTKDLVISVGKEQNARHSVAVMDGDGVYWKAKKDAKGNWVKDESGRIGDAEAFKGYASKQLGQPSEVPQAPAPAPTQKPEDPKVAAPEPSNFESLNNYNKFIANMDHVYNRYDLNVLADCYQHMNRMDRVRLMAAVNERNSRQWPTTGNWISVEDRKGTIVVSESDRSRTITSDPH